MSNIEIKQGPIESIIKRLSIGISGPRTRDVRDQSRSRSWSGHRDRDQKNYTLQGPGPGPGPEEKLYRDQNRDR